MCFFFTFTMDYPVLGHRYSFFVTKIIKLEGLLCPALEVTIYAKWCEVLIGQFGVNMVNVKAALLSLCYVLWNKNFKLHIYLVQPDMLITGKKHWVFVNYLLILNLPFCSHTVLMHACMYPPLQGFLYSFCWLLQILHRSMFVSKWAQLSASGFVWHLQQERPPGETWGGQLAMKQGDGVKFNQWSRTACHRFLNLLWPTSDLMAVK